MTGKITIGIAAALLLFGLPQCARAQKKPPKAGPKQPVSPFDGARPLVDPKDPAVAKNNGDMFTNVTSAIDTIDALGGCLEGEELRKTLKTIAQKLKQALAGGRLLVQDATKLGKGIEGATVNLGSDPGTAKVAVRRGLAFTGPPCTPNFITLLDTLLHEGLHMCQPSLAALKDLKPVDQVTQWKISKTANEAAAYGLESEVKRQLANQLDKMVKNVEADKPAMTGMPACMAAWKDCSLQQLRAARGRARAESAQADEVVVKLIADGLLDEKTKKPKTLAELRAQITKILKALQQAGLHKGPIDDEQILKYLQQYATAKAYLFSEQGDELSFVLDSIQGTIRGGHQEISIPGLRFPQDAILIRDKQGFPWLVIVGFNHLTDPSGCVVAIPADPSACRPVFDETSGALLGHRMIRFLFATDKTGVVVQNNPQLPRPTSLFQLPDGRVMVWDAQARGLFAVVDTNGDGIPDAFDSTNQARLPGDDTIDLSGLSDATWTGAAVELRVRVVVPICHSNSHQVYLTDTDGDGFFERWTYLRPSDLPSRSPVILGMPVAGARVLDVFGVPGDRVELRLHPANAVAPEQVIGRGAIPARGWGRISLDQPIEAGKRYSVSDLTNGRTSDLIGPTASAASISRVAPDVVPPGQTSTVELHGYGLDQVRHVFVDGVAAPHVLRGERLQVTLPAAPKGAALEITLELASGARVTAPHPVFTELFSD